MRIESPFHDGERLVQERAGERAMADVNGRVVARTVPRAAFGFITQQATAILGSVDTRGRPWASMLFGVPGFLQPRDETVVAIEVSHAWSNPHDPLWPNIEADRRLGMLLIELATRRRLRVNGRIEQAGGDTLLFHVDEAYPNCPKYIQRRHLVRREPVRTQDLPEPRRSDALEPDQQALVRAADTLFVASLHPGGGCDVSHRGGAPGFVEVLDASTIRIPDYPGNSMFNTLGNFTVHPRGGILVPDWERNRTLQLAGEVEIGWDAADPAGGGRTRRCWDLHVSETLELPLPVDAKWEFLDHSPFNP